MAHVASLPARSKVGAPELLAELKPYRFEDQVHLIAIRRGHQPALLPLPNPPVFVLDPTGAVDECAEPVWPRP